MANFSRDAILLYLFLTMPLYTSGIPAPAENSLTACSSTNPLNTSKDICGDLCEKGAPCAESGACICSKEPGPSMLGGQFTHCTNWCYVEQSECKMKCDAAGKNDHRVCWTFLIGNYCTCFNKVEQPAKPMLSSGSGNQFSQFNTPAKCPP